LNISSSNVREIFFMQSMWKRKAFMRQKKNKILFKKIFQKIWGKDSSRFSVSIYYNSFI
jgi:hypothetical protein